MSDSGRKLETEALRLPPEDRARLAERLITSLDEETEPEAQEAWLREAERRLDALESGEAAAVPAEEVIEKARSSIR